MQRGQMATVGGYKKRSAPLRISSRSGTRNAPSTAPLRPPAYPTAFQTCSSYCPDHFQERKDDPKQGDENPRRLTGRGFEDCSAQVIGRVGERFRGNNGRRTGVATIPSINRRET